MKTTVLDQQEIRPNGTIQLRFDKQVWDEGELAAREYHRGALVPLQRTLEGGWVPTDVDRALSFINVDLERLKSSPISAEDTATIKQLAAFIWTPEKVAQYQAEYEAAEAADKEKMGP